MNFSDADVWGPHYWFFLHTVAHSYPQQPNSVTKRKYYDFIQNMPLFIPEPEMGNKFSQLLDRYPVSPYLGTRESFVRWVHFIHNKMNVLLGKEEVSFLKSVDIYNSYYQSNPYVLSERLHINKHYLYGAVTLSCLFAIYVLIREPTVPRTPPLTVVYTGT
jgi:hypothetical protein